MRLVIALVAALTVGGASVIAVASVLAQGEATVTVVAGADEPAREWDIAVTGGTSSTDHLALAPIAVGFGADFTVAIAGSKANVTLTAALPPDRELASVGCLDDQNPPTEITPDLGRSSFSFDVVPGRGYRCFVESRPAVPENAAVAPAGAIKAPGKRLPRSDASPISTSAAVPGWLTVLVVLVVILGIAAALRPVRR